MARVDNDALVSDQGCHIKLNRRTWSKRLCTLLGWSISLIDLTLYLLYDVRGGGFVLLDPLAKIQLKY